VAFAQYNEKALAKALQQSGMTADEFLEEILSDTLNGPFPPDLWDPRK
jgi:hypothetical protein